MLDQIINHKTDYCYRELIKRRANVLKNSKNKKVNNDIFTNGCKLILLLLIQGIF